MKTILVIEDNEIILFNIKLLLEMNDYNPILARDGEEALEIMNSSEKPPDLIISDIMMPKIDGYTLYRAISGNPKWSRIPFIFVSAKSSPEDVRFGKILGADDYITKPFEEEDLLASIKGKLIRSENEKEFDEKLGEKVGKEVRGGVETTGKEDDIKDSLYLLVVFWDDKIGPYVKEILPKDRWDLRISIDDMASQLYETSVAIYGHQNFTKAVDVQIKISNVGMEGYLYFDSIQDVKIRGGKSLFLIGVLSPKIHYLATKRIHELFDNLSKKIKTNEEYELEIIWEEVISLLS
ncbi:MAG: response regulator [Candidatus Hodarchaeota archaeon]